MNIKFIGTGSMVSNDNQACYLVNDNIMVDMPNGTVKILKNINKLDSVEHLFITHIHGDHVFDIPFLLLDKLKREKNLTIYASRWCMPRIKRLVKMAFPRQYYPIMFSKYIKFVTNSKEVNLDGMRIRRFKVKHGKMKPCFGYSFYVNDKVVSFTGDASLTDTILEKAKESNYLISDCTLVHGNEKHMGADDMKLLLKNNNVTIIPSHMSPKAKLKLKEFKESNLLIKEDMEDLKI